MRRVAVKAVQIASAETVRGLVTKGVVDIEDLGRLYAILKLFAEGVLEGNVRKTLANRVEGGRRWRWC